MLVDRLTVREDVRARLVDSLEVCYNEGHGQAVIETAGERVERLNFSERFECKQCGIVYAIPEPRLFSFNNPYGACPTCQGFGNTIGLDLDLVIPNPQKSLAEGAVEPFTKPQYDWMQKQLMKFAKANKLPTTVPYAELTRDQRKAVFEGDPDAEYQGIRGFFDMLETKKYKLHVRVFLSKYRGYTLCPDCGGGRLRQEARDVKVGGLSMAEVCRMTVRDAAAFFESLELSTEDLAIADRVLGEVRDRLRFLREVGLDYLSLDRLASTLSGGEAQRIQLATNLGSSLVGALYILDEPSVGLHPRDNSRLINILKNLRDIGNTVLVVEHEPQMILEADAIIDIGPGAGEQGGEIIFAGTPDELMRERHVTYRQVPSRRVGDQDPARAAQAGWQQGPTTHRRTRAQPQRRRHRDPARPADVHHRCLRAAGNRRSSTTFSTRRCARSRASGRDLSATTAAIEGEKLIDEVVMVDQSPDRTDAAVEPSHLHQGLRRDP